jgi:hypothetical protein
MKLLNKNSADFNRCENNTTKFKNLTPQFLTYYENQRTVQYKIKCTFSKGNEIINRIDGKIFNRPASFNKSLSITVTWFFLSLAPQPNLGLGLLHKIQLNFLEAYQQFSFLQGRVLSPTPKPHTRRPGLCIYVPQKQGSYPL